MRTKLTIGLVLGALLGVAVAAQGGPVTVAVYRFQAQGDVSSFYKVDGAKCKAKWRKRKTIGIIVGRATNACVYRSSVLADAQDPGPDQEMAASTNLAAATPAKLRPKIYLSVAVRESNTTAYELRVYPAARKFQLVRDGRGSAGSTVLAGGSRKVIRPGAGVRNNLLLRAFDYGTASVTLLAKINGKRVFGAKDSAAGIPNGRRTTIAVGRRGSRSANRAVGAFDDVAIRVPDPF